MDVCERYLGYNHTVLQQSRVPETLNVCEYWGTQICGPERSNASKRLHHPSDRQLSVLGNTFYRAQSGFFGRVTQQTCISCPDALHHESMSNSIFIGLSS